MKKEKVYFSWDELKERGWSRILMLACFGGPDIVVPCGYGEAPREFFDKESVVFYENDIETSDYFSMQQELVAMAKERTLQCKRFESIYFCECFDIVIHKATLDSVRDSAKIEYDKRMFRETGEESHPYYPNWFSSLSPGELDQITVLWLKNCSTFPIALSHLNSIKYGLAELNIPNEQYMDCLDVLYDKFCRVVAEEYPELAMAAQEIKNSETLDAYLDCDIHRLKSVFSVQSTQFPSWQLAECGSHH